MHQAVHQAIKSFGPLTDGKLHVHTKEFHRCSNEIYNFLSLQTTRELSFDHIRLDLLHQRQQRKIKFCRTPLTN
jgi:hypothetical protein